VLLIDEMSMGLAPVVVETLMPLIRRVADESEAAVILVEQHVHLALEVADQAAVLVHGDVVVSGAAADLRLDAAALEAAYLGVLPGEWPRPGAGMDPAPGYARGHAGQTWNSAVGL
jgi:branched-chain amino acid transport system ATP-binding protein